RGADQSSGAAVHRRRGAVDPPDCGGDRQRDLRRHRRAHPPRAVLAGSGEGRAVVVGTTSVIPGHTLRNDAYSAARVIVFRAAAITFGTTASLFGAMMCTPATPGMSASAAMSSRQIACPSAAGSCAASMRAINASGMIEPNSLSLIQRAERADFSGTM